MRWKEFLKYPKLRLEMIFTLILLSVTLFALTHFLNYVEARQGVVLPDPVLALFKPFDLTWLIFSLIYCSLILAVVMLALHPDRLMLALQVYTLFVLVRIAAMYLMPINPPLQMIRLDDPFVQYFGTGKLLTKDLFFSGHTATLFLLFLVTKNKIIKPVFLLFTVAVGISLLLQHVHYTIDVFAAPFFTYTCYKLVLLFNERTIGKKLYSLDK